MRHRKHYADTEEKQWIINIQAGKYTERGHAPRVHRQLDIDTLPLIHRGKEQRTI